MSAEVEQRLTWCGVYALAGSSARGDEMVERKNTWWSHEKDLIAASAHTGTIVIRHIRTGGKCLKCLFRPASRSV